MTPTPFLEDPQLITSGPYKLTNAFKQRMRASHLKTNPVSFLLTYINIFDYQDEVTKPVMI